MSCRSTPPTSPHPLEHQDVFGITFEQGRNDLDISDATMLQNIVTDEQGAASDEAAARDLIIAPDRAEVHPVQLACATRRTARPSAWAPASRAASTAPAWQATRPTTGSCATIPRCWACRSVHDICQPNRDNAIDVYISDDM